MSAWQRAGDHTGPDGLSPCAAVRALPGGASWVAHSSPDVGAPVEAEFGVWALLGRMLLAGIGLLLVIPAPWAMTSYYRWFISHLRVPTVPGPGFTGRPGDICGSSCSPGFASYAGLPHLHHHIHYLRFLIIFVEPVLSWLILRWVVANLSSEDPASGATSPAASGAISAGIYSALPCVRHDHRWAWGDDRLHAMDLPQHRGSDAKPSPSTPAVGRCYGRTLAFVLASCFIIPIPWMLHW